MNKKSLLLTTIIISLFFLTPAFSQIKLFEDILEPKDSLLLELFKNYRKPNTQVENLIEKLRERIQNNRVSKEEKIDLAAFLLRKVMIDHKSAYEDNEKLLLEVSELIPEDFYLESVWADLLLSKSDYENSIKHYELALNIQPNNVKTMAKCGICYYYTFNYEKAIEYCEAFLEKKPNDFDILYIVALSKFELHEYDDAIDYAEKALEICKNLIKKEQLLELIRKAKEASFSNSDATQDADQKFIITFAGNSKDDLGDFAFDTLNSIYYDVTTLLNCDPNVKINVIFFLTDDYYKENKDWSAASALGITVRVPLATGYKSEEYVKGVLAHEFTHTIINLKTQNRAPIWVHEGLAQYQEFRTEFGSEENLRPDYVSIYENDFKENGFFIPLDKIPAYMKSGDHKDVCRAYIASWLAIRCMGDLYSESSFDTLLTSLGKGNNIKQAVEDATGQSYNGFQEEMKQWIKNQ